METLIDRDKCQERIRRFADRLMDWGRPEQAEAVRAVAKGIKLEKTVDAVPVVHGRWEPRTDAIGFVRCSVCHDCNIYNDWPDGKKWNYCPHCGAHMDLEVKDA